MATLSDAESIRNALIDIGTVYIRLIKRNREPISFAPPRFAQTWCSQETNSSRRMTAFKRYILPHDMGNLGKNHSLQRAQLPEISLGSTIYMTSRIEPCIIAPTQGVQNQKTCIIIIKTTVRKLLTDNLIQYTAVYSWKCTNSMVLLVLGSGELWGDAIHNEVNTKESQSDAQTGSGPLQMPGKNRVLAVVIARLEESPCTHIAARFTQFELLVRHSCSLHHDKPNIRKFETCPTSTIDQMVSSQGSPNQ